MSSAGIARCDLYCLQMKQLLDLQTILVASPKRIASRNHLRTKANGISSRICGALLRELGNGLSHCSRQITLPFPMPFLLGLTHMDLWQNSDENSASNSKIRVRQHVGISGFLSLLVLQSLQIPMHLRCSGRSPRSCTTCDILLLVGIIVQENH
uniref:Uncharacterized protein n=1 Tax=Spongospora subterranea TaxID=70186 RepID=A0A0H5QZ07_9EUKA|eukprot:CRZ07170.1 hypothetical protein [Spongospora subterranea]